MSFTHCCTNCSTLSIAVLQHFATQPAGQQCNTLHCIAYAALALALAVQPPAPKRQQSHFHPRLISKPRTYAMHECNASTSQAATATSTLQPQAQQPTPSPTACPQAAVGRQLSLNAPKSAVGEAGCRTRAALTRAPACTESLNHPSAAADMAVRVVQPPGAVARLTLLTTATKLPTNPPHLL